MNTKNQIKGWWEKIALSALIASGAWQLIPCLAQAEPVNRQQILVEKKVSDCNSPTLYQTGSANIYVAPKGSASEVQAKLDAANGNIYATAINSGNISRGLVVVHEGGRTLLVASRNSDLVKVARAKHSNPNPESAPKIAAINSPNP